MLSIGKLAVGQERYYEQQVAKGLDDYYTGRGEAPGRWLGAGARGLGLMGTVEDGELGRLMQGEDPKSGGKLRAKDVEIAALDLTFSAPKSISVLSAIGDERLQQELVGCHEEAVEASLAYLEETALFVRRGQGGRRFERPAGLVVAAFRHRMSRALDPQLHTHCIAANMASGEDGRFTALHHPSLYQAALTGGYLYQAHLRRLVHERLGLVWGEVHKGMAELAAVPEAALSEFSRRRHEMQREAARGGLALDSKARGQAAALVTRERKQYGVETHAWRDECKARAQEHGLDEETVRKIIGRGLERIERDRVGIEDPAELKALFDQMASDQGLTEKRNAVGARDVLRAIAQAAGQGALIEEVRARGRQFARRPDVLKTTHLELTTAELVGVENRLIAAAQGRASEGIGRVDRNLLEDALRICAQSLTEEQRAAVVATVSSGHGVQVIEALAGTGKTYTAGVLRYVYERAGHEVIGVAPTGRAVRELAEHAGAPSHTLSRVAGLLREGATLPDRCVILLDEAGMAGTRETAVLLEAAEQARAKVIAIGDPGQLHSVQAGGWMRAVGRKVGVLKLSEVMRQHDLGERRALARLHEGVRGGWLGWATANDRVSVGAEREQLRMAVERWAEGADEHGLAQAVLIARSNDTRRALNELARARVRERGGLGDSFRYGPVELAVGDRVICRRNDRQVDVDNGTRGTVRAVTAERVVIETDGRTIRELPARYVAEHVEYAYALTGHGAQGATVSWAGVVASPSELTRGWSYTALSRARETTLLFVLSEGEEYSHHELSRRDEIGPAEQTDEPSEGDVLARVARYMLERDDEDLAVERIAPELGAGRPPDRELLAAENAPVAPLQEQGAEQAGERYPKPSADRIRECGQWLLRLTEQLEALSGKEVHRLESLERQETQLLDAERAAARRLELLPPRSPLRRDRDARVRANLETELDGVRVRLEGVRRLRGRLERQLGPLGEVRAERDGLHAAIANLERERAAMLHGLAGDAVERPPEWALRELGPPPDHRQRRQMWRRAAEQALAYRIEHRVEDQTSALGIQPADGTPERGEHTRAWLELHRTRQLLSREPSAARPRDGLPRGWRELLGHSRADGLEEPLHRAREHATKLPAGQLEQQTTEGKAAFARLDQSAARQAARLEREHAEHADRAARQIAKAEHWLAEADALGRRRRHAREQLRIKAETARAYADGERADAARIELALKRLLESGKHPDQWLEQHAPTALAGLAARDELGYRQHLEQHRQAERVLVQPPEHIRALIGNPPVSGVKASRRWERLAQDVEHHAVAHRIDVERDGPLGPDPERIPEPRREVYQQAREQLAERVEAVRRDRGLEPDPQAREILDERRERAGDRELDVGLELDR